jgi:hypothetical protein
MSVRRWFRAPANGAAPLQISMYFALAWIRQQLELSVEPVDRAQDDKKSDGLTALWPLTMAASVLGDAIDAGILAQMLEMDDRHLDPLLAELEAAGVLRYRGQTGGSLFEFADRRTREAAYAQLEPQVRAALHHRAADRLGECAATEFHADAARIAEHYEAAAAWVEAFSWWRKAAERAIAETLVADAAAFLQRGLAICQRHPDAVSPEVELAALGMLGPLQAQLKGSGAREVADVYARCLEIAGGFGNKDRTATFDALWGLSACILVHGRVDTAREIGKLLLNSAEAAGDATQILLATRLKGLGSLLAGEIGPAIGNFAAVEKLYDVHRHAPLRFRYASDQIAVALAHKAWAEAIAGQAEVSQRTRAAALDHVERLQHPHTSAHVLCVLAACAQTLQLRKCASPLAYAGLALARRHCFPYWEAWAQIILGWHQAAYAPEAGQARIDSAISAYRSTGAGQALPYAQLLRAGVALGTGDIACALRAADDALDLSAAHGVVLFEAEILRTKAQALGQQQGRQALLETAVATARRQGAWLFEARAVQALSNLAI